MSVYMCLVFLGSLLTVIFFSSTCGKRFIAEVRKEMAQERPNLNPEGLTTGLQVVQVLFATLGAFTLVLPALFTIVMLFELCEDNNDDDSYPTAPAPL